jgi:hypothetical protein
MVFSLSVFATLPDGGILPGKNIKMEKIKIKKEEKIA